MNRFNYLSDAHRSGFPSVSATVAIDNRVRGPLATLVATVILTSAISLVQLSRLHVAQRSYAVVSSQLAAGNASLQAVTNIRRRVEVKTRLATQIADVRRVSIRHINELTWIGNRLPPDAWLTTLRFDNGNYSLEGTSERVAAVSSALLALRDSAGGKVPRLISLRNDDAPGNSRHVHYTLRLESQP